jgi:MFS transporter, SP family, arabinose:H+ symporter
MSDNNKSSILSNQGTVRAQVEMTQAKKGFAFLVAFIAAAGGFLFGYDLHIITAGQIFWRNFFQLTDAGFGFATSSAILGCIGGPFLGGWMSDRFGRRATLIFAGSLFGISAIGVALSQTISIFNVFRITGGLGVGLASIASPMYIAEIAPARIRGRLCLMYQMAITVGSTSAALVGYGLSFGGHWRWMFGSMVVPVIAFIICLCRVPESPRWLAEADRNEEALDVLTKIDGPEAAQKEMSEIKASLALEQGKYSELFAPGLRMALVIAVLLAFFNNLTGWSGIAYYLPVIFQKGGYSDPSRAILNMLILNVFNMLFTLVCIWLVDRTGRRPLWIRTSTLMIFSLTFAGLAFQLQWTGPVIILVIIFCSIPHHLGLGPLPWLMMSELFPTRLRARGVAVSTTILWMGGFVGPMLFPIIAGFSERHIGSIALIFALFAVICIFSIIFGLKLLPETKGRSLEDIAKSWHGIGH